MNILAALGFGGGMAKADEAAARPQSTATKSKATTRTQTTWDFFGDNNAAVVNPFPAAREKLRSFNDEITDIASQGKHIELERVLREYLSVLIHHNNSISRYIATPFKKKAAETPSQNNLDLANEVNQLFREHNSYFIQLRGLLKRFISDAPDLAPSSNRVDDFVMLDEAQTDLVKGMLDDYSLVLRSLEAIWARLERFENAVYPIKKQG